MWYEAVVCLCSWQMIPWTRTMIKRARDSKCFFSASLVFLRVSTVNRWPDGLIVSLCGHLNNWPLWAVSESWLALTNDWQLIFDLDWPHWLRRRPWSVILFSCNLHFANLCTHARHKLPKKYTHSHIHIFTHTPLWTHLFAMIQYIPSYVMVIDLTVLYLVVGVLQIIYSSLSFAL